MRAVDIITKKRDRGILTAEEIQFFVEGFTRGEIPDYQVSAWAMAILLNGMNARETTDLAVSMAHSGKILNLSEVVGISVDKHSTGGVGDKTSLVVLPIVAASGLPVGKMSGHGLGFSGGTLDKLESIPGYRVDLSINEFKKQLAEIGIVLTGQTVDLAPADGKLYALRDVTGTVQSIPLIASSIMSKKIAAGANAILLDVKTGLGAFMHTLDEARELARLMISIGENAGRKVVALLSAMDQPLGQAVGNALELREAIETLHGKGPADFREHCLTVAAHMLLLGEKAKDLEFAEKLAQFSLDKGTAYIKLMALVAAQGGDVSFIDDPDKLPRANFITEVNSPMDGYLSQVNARTIGEAAVALGAGRVKKGDPVDHAVGLVVHHKVGEKVKKGDPLFSIYASQEVQLEEIQKTVITAFAWSETPVAPLPLFYGIEAGHANLPS